MTNEQILGRVLKERERQERLHGESNANLNYWDHEYMTIIAEEVGEVCQALFNFRHMRDDESLEEYRSELTQVIAVGWAILEKIP